jgi:hypothetical protein
VDSEDRPVPHLFSGNAAIDLALFSSDAPADPLLFQARDLDLLAMSDRRLF